MCIEGTDGDDPAAGALCKMRHGRSDHPEKALADNPVSVVHVVCFELAERFKDRKPGIGHENIQCAEGIHGVVDQLAACIWLGQIAEYDCRIATGSFNGLCGLLTAGLVGFGMNKNTRAGLCQAFCDGRTDPAAGAGNQRCSCFGFR